MLLKYSFYIHLGLKCMCSDSLLIYDSFYLPDCVRINLRQYKVSKFFKEAGPKTPLGTMDLGP